MITHFDRVCISVADPVMQDELGLSQNDWGWVVGLFTLSYALFEIPTGAMGDRLARRITLSRIVVWWSAFTALTGTVSNFWVLLTTRFFFGAGESQRRQLDFQAWAIKGHRDPADRVLRFA